MYAIAPVKVRDDNGGWVRDGENKKEERGDGYG